MHSVSHQLSFDDMVRMAMALDEAGMPLIEVTHGDGLGGSYVNYGYGRHTNREYLEAGVQKIKNTKISAMLLQGLGTVKDLAMAVDCRI